MSTMKQTYKTTINCSGCVRAVSPALNLLVGEGNWEVNTETADKILTIHESSVPQEDVMLAVEKAGFNIEKL